MYTMCFGQMHSPFSLLQPLSYSCPNFPLPTSHSGFVLFPTTHGVPLVLSIYALVRSLSGFKSLKITSYPFPQHPPMANRFSDKGGTSWTHPPSMQGVWLAWSLEKNKVRWPLWSLWLAWSTWTLQGVSSSERLEQISGLSAKHLAGWSHCDLQCVFSRQHESTKWTPLCRMVSV